MGDEVNIFLTLTATFLTISKNGLGPFFDAHQLGVRLKFDVDVKTLTSTVPT